MTRLFFAFVLGILTMRVVADREIAALKVAAECAYHEGYSEGFRDHSFEVSK